VVIPVLWAQDCKELQKATPSRLLDFLDKVKPNKQNGECVTFAIKKLGEQHYKPATSILTKFLDFRRPPTDEEKAGVIAFRTFYPATTALEQIGKESQPSILKAIESGSTSLKALWPSISALVWGCRWQAAR
jgi:hypothetical protein